MHRGAFRAPSIAALYPDPQSRRGAKCCDFVFGGVQPEQCHGVTLVRELGTLCRLTEAGSANGDAVVFRFMFHSDGPGATRRSAPLFDSLNGSMNSSEGATSVGGDCRPSEGTDTESCLWIRVGRAGQASARTSEIREPYDSTNEHHGGRMKNHLTTTRVSVTAALFGYDRSIASPRSLPAACGRNKWEVCS